MRGVQKHGSPGVGPGLRVADLVEGTKPAGTSGEKESQESDRFMLA